ncbi:MAG: hypothetical protein IPG53_22970 [Ignavibacteriales bacterium]|nr:hypothetical protein [Ignavibacteriales bacterium]
MQPLITLQEKKEVYAAAVEEDWTLTPTRPKSCGCKNREKENGYESGRKLTI